VTVEQKYKSLFEQKVRKMNTSYVCAVYVIGIIIWISLWIYSGAMKSQKVIKALYIPFFLCIFFMLANGLILGCYPSVGNVDLEESLFNFLETRTSLTLEVSASVLVVATIIYGVSREKFPKLFIRLETLSFVCLIGLMSPVTWIPINKPDWLMVLRHAQTVPFLMGIFLCVSGIMVLLYDLSEIAENKGFCNQKD
jgi:hypothetical protein